MNGRGTNYKHRLNSLGKLSESAGIGKTLIGSITKNMWMFVILGYLQLLHGNRSHKKLGNPARISEYCVVANVGKLL
jgi:hypothetical protein